MDGEMGGIRRVKSVDSGEESRVESGEWRAESREQRAK